MLKTFPGELSKIIFFQNLKTGNEDGSWKTEIQSIEDTTLFNRLCDNVKVTQRSLFLNQLLLFCSFETIEGQICDIKFFKGHQLHGRFLW